jgi:hypothetical protein
VAAFTITGNSQPTKSEINKLFYFLSDFRNLAGLLPVDKVENFNCTETACAFEVKGIARFSLVLEEKKPFHHISFASTGDSKYQLGLKVMFSYDENQTGMCRIELKGDLNPFIFTMAKKPLTKLVDDMTVKLSELQPDQV